VRVQPGAVPSEWRLVEADQEIGYIRDATVGFRGFRTQAEAAQAAQTAHRALERRRSKARWLPRPPEDFVLAKHQEAAYVVARSGLVARLRPPDLRTGVVDWGFEIDLHPEESASVFAMSRARTMWNALRASGWPRRMREFSAGDGASGEPAAATAGEHS
jgi:hypothetical protein